MNLVRQRIWGGKILIRVTISEPESIGSQDYLLVAGRVSYLHAYLPKILAYFDRYLDESREGDWWFEYQDEPIPSSRPVGLLYDILVGPSDGEPWHITLKRGDYPIGKILQFGEDNSIETYWTNQFKESCYIRDGNSNAVMLLPREDHEALWWSINNSASLDESISKLSFNTFWQHMSILTKRSQTPWNVPLRFYVVSAGSSEKGLSLIQVIGKSHQAIAKVIPGSLKSGYQIVVHGVTVKPDMPLSDLYLSFTYPDGFLHIMLRYTE